MYKLIWFVGLFFTVCINYGQELNANVTVNHSQVGNSNQAYFKTLEKSLKEFINNTSWTSKKFAPSERIDCSFFLTVNTYGNNTVSGSLQVQSSRPIYNSTYSSTVFSFNDKDITFNYIEFEPLYYNTNSFDSNLTSLIAYYVNMILGLDSETFSKGSGSNYFQTALSINSIAQQSGYRGWKQADGTNNRYYLVNDIVAGTGLPFREALYMYHRLGMDIMASNVEQGREGIFNALLELEKIHKSKPNSFLVRVFLDAKSDELVNIYSGVTDKNKKRVVELLNRIAPLSSSKWNSL